MLVLARKKGESIMIGDEIELTILAVEGETVKVGLAAPKQVQIYRKEVFTAIQESNREAASQSLDSGALLKLLRQLGSDKPKEPQ